MVYERLGSMSKPCSGGCHVASSKPSSNRTHDQHAVSTAPKTQYRNVLTFLVLMCLCCHLPTGHCAKDRRLSKNTVNVVSHPEFSSGEKQPNALPRPQPGSVVPSRQPTFQNPKEALQEDENRMGQRSSAKRPELATKPRPESGGNKSQTQQRQAVTKRRTETKTAAPSEATSRLTKTDRQNQPELARGFPDRRQQSFPNKLLQKKELCPPKSLVHYNVTFIPLWSSKRFPKMYPTYRPNAQWSKAIGRTHDYSYNMWKLNTFASPAVKSFAEEGYAVDFDTETQGESGIYDMFTMPAVYRGFGSSKGSIFLDGTHPLVSLMVKIVPSPDWFVGVSGLNLCAKGKWRKKAIVRLFPVDAGTDKGLTFTSPNWPSYPPERITRITSSSPDHDASSFYYPKLKKLPRIGYVIFHKTMESKTIFKRQKPYKVHLAGVSDQTYSALMGRDKEIPSGSHKPTTLVQSDQRPGAKKTETDSVISSEEPPSRISSRLEIIDSEPGTPLDCLVNNWSLWTECSKTCGFGRRSRHRFVTQTRQNHGLICPKLKEEELCGSMRNCKWSHFQPYRWQALQRPRSALSRRH